MCTRTPSPSNVFCRLQQRKVPQFPQLSPGIQGELLGPRPQGAAPGPFSLSSDLGVQAGQAPKSRTVIDQVCGAAADLGTISFLLSADITNICQEPHSGQSDLYKTQAAFVNTFTELHRMPGTAGLGSQWRAEQTETRPLKKVKSQRGTGPTVKGTSGQRP